MRNQRNYRIMLGMSLLQGFVFYAPVATIYRQTYGLSLSELFLIESISWILTVILEAPFGAFADRFGYRNTIVFGATAFFASKLVFAAASGFALFLIERVILSISLAALSGANEILLSLSVGDENTEGAFGLWNAAGTAGLLAASLLSPLLYRSSLRTSAYATAITYGLAMALSLFLAEPQAACPRGKRATPGEMASVFRALVSDRSLLFFLAAIAVCNEAAQAATVFLSQPQYQRVGLGEGSYGVLFALIQCAALAGASAGKVVQRRGRKLALEILIAVECACFVALAAEGPAGLTITALILMSAAASIIRPLSVAAQIYRIRIPNRATALSLNAMVMEIVAASVNVAAGRIVEGSLALGFWAMAGMLALILVLSPRLLAAADDVKNQGAKDER